MDFWERLDDRILKKNLTRKGVAKVLGFAVGNFGSWKSREDYPTADRCLRIAKLLETTVEYLVEGEEPAGWLPPKVILLAKAMALLNDKDFETVSTVVRALAAQYQSDAADPRATWAAERERDALQAGRNLFPNELDQVQPDRATEKKA